MKYLRVLLLPFSLLYGLVVVIRNWLYDAGIFKSRPFLIPVISVGNLQAGGSGKTPMTAYLATLLKDNYKTAILSRGYGRKTKGFILGESSAGAAQIGDEPAQYKNTFKDVTVAVCEDRVHGITQLMGSHQLVLLDDAYQHRAVKPGFSILLFDYNNLNAPQWLLPAGNLREPMWGRWRADVIVVTKCPAGLTLVQEEEIAARIKPFTYQQLFFTAINYLPFQDMQGNPVNTVVDADTTVYLLTGIANPAPLLQHLQKFTHNIVHHKYPDHYTFSLKNISKLAAEFSACTAPKKLLLTTEKDARRLLEPHLQQLTQQMPFTVLPVGIQFLGEGEKYFNNLILNYVREHTTNHGLH